MNVFLKKYSVFNYSLTKICSYKKTFGTLVKFKTLQIKHTILFGIQSSHEIDNYMCLNRPNVKITKLVLFWYKWCQFLMNFNFKLLEKTLVLCCFQCYKQRSSLAVNFLYAILVKICTKFSSNFDHTGNLLYSFPPQIVHSNISSFSKSTLEWANRVWYQ